MKLQAVITERKRVPRKMLTQHRRAASAAWLDTARLFIEQMVPSRFTEAHAREAGYVRRKGELLPPGSKAFKRSYTGRKLQKYGHTLPLVASGETRDNILSGVSAKATSGGVRIRFPAARKFNYRHPKSQIRMNEEFRRITHREAVQLGAHFDRVYDRLMQSGSEDTTTQ